MIERLLNYIAENKEVITGAVFAFVIAFMQRKGDFMNKVSGAFLCSLFSTGLYCGVVSIFPSVPPVCAVAIGSFVGFYGVDETKKLILDKIKSFLENKKDKDNE